ncbi:MAG: glycosyltransferase [Actinobacteria bacterium]|nr:glycosyltransferase [Actinomycetota bacterium]
MPRVVHVITTLHPGGAELFLARLLLCEPKLAEGAHVICMGDGGPVAEALKSGGIRVSTLGMDRSPKAAWGVMRARSLVAAWRPDMVQTWLYHADLLGTLAAASRAPVVWNLRDAAIDAAHLRRTTALVMRTCASISRWAPARIVCCSRASMEEHTRLGYDARKMTVIRNGFDLRRFHPRQGPLGPLRQECRLPKDALAVGLFARWHPKKNHLAFLRAMGGLLRADPRLHLVLAGRGVCPGNSALRAAAEATGAAERVHLLGHRDNVDKLFPMLDVLVSASSSEGMPNVVGEAMACGVPCVVTDVGDSAYLVGNTGRVVPAGDDPALVAAVAEVAYLPQAERASLGASARRRIIERFSLEASASRYLSLYEEVSRQPRGWRRATRP